LPHCREPEASILAAQAVLPDMKAAKAGVIINFGSTSWMVGQGGMAAYSASKAGVLGLTVLRAHLGGTMDRTTSA
jgi:NAD(P)-dependent dehydrogenase (short-subunit alcohol dehydrogenase family)